MEIIAYPEKNDLKKTISEEKKFEEKLKKKNQQFF